MAMDAGGNLRSRAAVISGTEVRSLASSASHIVEITGDPKAAWIYTILCTIVTWGVHGTARYDVCNISFAA